MINFAIFFHFVWKFLLKDAVHWVSSSVGFLARQTWHCFSSSAGCQPPPQLLSHALLLVPSALPSTLPTSCVTAFAVFYHLFIFHLCLCPSKYIFLPIFQYFSLAVSNLLNLILSSYFSYYVLILELSFGSFEVLRLNSQLQLFSEYSKQLF